MASSLYGMQLKDGGFTLHFYDINIVFASKLVQVAVMGREARVSVDENRLLPRRLLTTREQEQCILMHAGCPSGSVQGTGSCGDMG